jgi:integrase
MPAMSSAAADAIEVARQLLARLGVDVADLIAAPLARPVVPTFAEYVPRVSATVGVSSRRAYSSYWKKIVAAWGQRRLDAVNPTDIEQLGEQVRANRVVRANSRDGSSTVENLYTALRCLYAHAVREGLLSEDANPARKVAKPRRHESLRRAVPDTRQAEIYHVASTTGNDPELDTLLLRIHVETACRRGGALALRPIDLDTEQCLIRLREKGGTQRWQPVSPTLMAHLQHHAEQRHAPATGQLLRYRTGRPITSRRYDHLWQRVGEHLPWVAAQQVSAHWLRHTTLTWVERTFSHAVARAYAGHSGVDRRDTTAGYTRATLAEVATALANLTGEPHPIANSE